MILTDTCLGKGEHCWHVQPKSPLWPDTPSLGPSGSPTPHGLDPGSRTRGPAEGLQGLGDLGPSGSPVPPSLGPGSWTRGPAGGFGEQAHHLWRHGTECLPSDLLRPSPKYRGTSGWRTQRGSMPVFRRPRTQMEGGYPVVTRECRRNSRKTTWFPPLGKMRPLPATASQGKSPVPP